MIVDLRFGENSSSDATASKQPFHEGNKVRIRFDLPNVHLFDRATGHRIALA